MLFLLSSGGVIELVTSIASSSFLTELVADATFVETVKLPPSTPVPLGVHAVARSNVCARNFNARVQLSALGIETQWHSSRKDQCLEPLPERGGGDVSI